MAISVSISDYHLMASEVQQEIALLDKVLTKLALTPEPDLPSVLERFLGGILEKLESPHEQTRNKVLLISPRWPLWLYSRDVKM